MRTNDIEAATKALNELNRSYIELFSAVKSTVHDVEATKRLWRGGNKSRLIKLGIALIAFPEPTPISETIGACFVAAGLVQKGIQNRAIFLEDVTKTFQNTLKDTWTIKHSLQI